MDSDLSLSLSHIPAEMWLQIVSGLPLNDLVSFSHTSKYNYSIMIVDLRKRYCAMLGRTLAETPHHTVNNMIKFLRLKLNMAQYPLFYISHGCAQEDRYYYRDDIDERTWDGDEMHIPEYSLPKSTSPQKIVKHAKSQHVYQKHRSMRPRKHKQGYR
jgi:hypothetical protein